MGFFSSSKTKVANTTTTTVNVNPNIAVDLSPVAAASERISESTADLVRRVMEQSRVEADMRARESSKVTAALGAGLAKLGGGFGDLRSYISAGKAETAAGFALGGRELGGGIRRAAEVIAFAMVAAGGIYVLAR